MQHQRVLAVAHQMPTKKLVYNSSSKSNATWDKLNTNEKEENVWENIVYTSNQIKLLDREGWFAICVCAYRERSEVKKEEQKRELVPYHTHVSNTFL